MTACLAALGTGCGWLYQRTGEQRDARRFPPPGRLVDIGGRRLHVIQTGASGPGPTVVILPAMGATALEWHQVTQALPANLTVYAVDRGGLGWSDPAPFGPRTPTVLAAETTALLNALNLSSVVLVGHSYGGLAARVTAATNPGRVAGLALIDASDEHQMRPLAAASPSLHASELWRLAARHQARPLGWYRAWHDLTGRRHLIHKAVREVGERMAPAAVARGLTTAHRRAAVAEMLGLARAPRTTPGWTRQLGDLPVTVLTVGESTGWGTAYPVWLELQRSFLQMTTRAHHLVLPGTGHHMNRDIPGTVATAIAELVAFAVTGTANGW